jgi:hypothetical protein
MKYLLVLLVLTVGCHDMRATNPVSAEYPCGTRAHPCSRAPLTCCWNAMVCGGLEGTGCPAGMCCAIDNERTPQWLGYSSP